MGRRLRLNEYQIFNQVDTSTNPESAPTDVSAMDSIVYHLLIDASVNAELSVLVCNTLVFDATKAYALNFETPLLVEGGTDNEYMVRVENKGFKWMQIYVANNGGTGNIDGWITGTSVGN